VSKDIQPAEEPAIAIDSFCAATPEDCISLFKTDFKYGLTAAQVEANRNAYGGNKLPVLNVDPVIHIAFEQLAEPLTAVRVILFLFTLRRERFTHSCARACAGAPRLHHIWPLR